MSSPQIAPSSRRSLRESVQQQEEEKCTHAPLRTPESANPPSTNENPLHESQESIGATATTLTGAHAGAQTRRRNAHPTTRVSEPHRTFPTALSTVTGSTVSFSLSEFFAEFFPAPPLYYV